MIRWLGCRNHKPRSSNVGDSAGKQGEQKLEQLARQAMRDLGQGQEAASLRAAAKASARCSSAINRARMRA